MKKYATDNEIDYAIQILRVSYSKIDPKNPLRDKLMLAVNHVIWMLEEIKKED